MIPEQTMPELLSDLRRLLGKAGDAAGKLNATNPTGLFLSREIEEFAVLEREFFEMRKKLSELNGTKRQ